MKSGSGKRFLRAKILTTPVVLSASDVLVVAVLNGFRAFRGFRELAMGELGCSIEFLEGVYFSSGLEAVTRS